MPRVTVIYGLLNIIFGGFLDFIDKRQIVRRAMVLICLWLLVDCYLWAKGYAMLPGKTGADLGIVIGTILTPVTALQGFLYRMYNDGRVVDGVSADREGRMGQDSKAG